MVTASSGASSAVSMMVVVCSKRARPAQAKVGARARLRDHGQGEPSRLGLAFRPRVGVRV